MAKKNKKGFSFFLNGKIDYAILIITCILVCFGLIMLLSASAPTSISETGKSTKYLIKQGEVVLLGSFIALIISKIDYRIFRKFRFLIYAVCVGILFAVGFLGEGANRS